MRMTEIDFEGPPPIDGYGPNGFRVAGAWHEGGLLLGPSIRQGLGALDPGELAPVMGGQVDLVIFGMGADIAALPPGLRERFDAAGIGVEIMGTPSACRTYNVLLTEGRRCAAALLPVG